MKSIILEYALPPAIISFGLNEFKKVGELITKVIQGLSKNKNDNSKIELEVKNEVIELCSKFPIYNHLVKN